MAIQTLRPGLLVSLKTSLSGNVLYRTVDLETDHVTEEGQRKARWETERTIQDPAEHERAVKQRGKARSLITGICAASSFGLLCPESKRDELTAAIEEARQVADDFNQSATQTRISVFVIVGRVAADDAEAIRAINSEVRDLLGAMESGVRNLDPTAIRDAANKARALGSMLTDTASERVKVAIETARKAARVIVKAGDQAAVTVDQASLRAIDSARTAFLEIEDAPELTEVESVSRGVDFEPASPAYADLGGKPPMRAIELPL